MTRERTSPRPSDANELYALIAASGVWGLAPDWVPRGGYTRPTRSVLRRVETGLLIEPTPRIGEEQ